MRTHSHRHRRHASHSLSGHSTARRDGVSGYSQVICGGLLLLIALTPWIFGGVWASVQAWLLAAVAVLLVVDVAEQLLSSRSSRSLPTIYIPLILGILLGMVQLVPWPQPVDQWLAPTASDLREQLLGDELTQLGVSVPEPTTRSVYPAATRQQLALLLLVISVFVLASRHFSSKTTLPWLLGGGAVLGGAIALFGLIQKLSWNGMMYWQFPLSMGGSPFGPFVNRNNAGGFLNLTIACAAGWLIWVTWPRFSGGPLAAEQEGDEESDEADSNDAEHELMLAQFVEEHRKREKGKSQLPKIDLQAVANYVAHLDAAGLAILALLGLIGASIIVSLSRGSILAMLAAGASVVILLMLRRGSRSFALPMFAALALAVFVMGWIGETDAVKQRLATLLGDELMASEGRLKNWPDAVQTAAFYMIGGSGLGTYPFAYGASQDWFSGESIFYYAENQFIQTLVEVGIIGVGLLVAAIFLVGRAVQFLFKFDRPATLAVSVTGTYALASQLVGGTFDFGLYIPANALLMSALCGAIVGRAVRLTKKSNRKSYSLRIPAPKWAVPAVFALLLVGTVSSWIEMRRVARVESAWAVAPFTEIRQQREAQQLDKWYDVWMRATQTRPDDYRTHQHLAEIWLQRYRVATLERLKQENPDLAEDELWDRTELFQVHAAIRGLQAEEGGAAEVLRLQLAVADYFKPAWQHLLLARRCCPLVPHLHYALAEICLASMPGQSDELHLARARELAPGDATLWFWSGVLDMNSGRLTEATRAWRQSLLLSPMHENEIVPLAKPRMAIDELLTDVLLDDPESLLRIARRHFSAPDDRPDQEVILAKADGLLRAARQLEPRDRYVWATVLRMREQPTEALEQYALAVQQAPQELAWRYEYAQLLQQQGLLEEAYRQIQYCVQADSRSERYQKVLEQVRHAMVRKGGAKE